MLLAVECMCFYSRALRALSTMGKTLQFRQNKEKFVRQRNKKPILIFNLLIIIITTCILVPNIGGHTPDSLQRTSLILTIRSIDTCQNKVSADQYHMPISQAQV